MVKAIKGKIRERIISEHRALFAGNNVDEKDLKEAIVRILEEINLRERAGLSEGEKKGIISEILDELIGFGPIENLLKDPAITEIMINGPKEIYTEKNGRTELSNVTFDDEGQLMALIYKILAPTRRRVDESYPYTEVSLKDGSRVNIIIPPVALEGPIVSIRKFLKEIKSAEDLIKLGTLDRRMSDLLVASIRAKINLIFSGATGAGKTTTLNVFSSYIPADERIVTIEDTAELRLNQKHVVRLETRQPNIEGKGEITIRELFKNSLRMRPDRIILGEIRGNEALDLLQSICSGHKGSLAVIHGNSPQDVIYRLETMILSSGVPISLEVIHRHIAAAVNLIVQQEQLVDGSRKITRVSQVNGLRDNQVIIEDIFVYDLEGIDEKERVKGRWRSTGRIPVFYPLFRKAGIALPKEIFNEE